MVKVKKRRIGSVNPMRPGWLKEPCWCCGGPRVVIYRQDGELEEVCQSRKYADEDRCAPPCKYFSGPGLIVTCDAHGRKDGNCKGRLKCSKEKVKKKKIV